MVIRLGIFIFVVTFGCFVFGVQLDTYSEDVLIKRLASQRHLLVQFTFTSKRFKAFDNHFTLFPSVIGKLVEEHDLDELHLSLTQGYWRHRLWGLSPHPSAPTGAQLWAWFTNQTQVDTKYKNLIHTLSGFFCASLEQMYPTLTSAPQMAFRPTGPVIHQPHNSRLRYSILANENVCTENLTPWKKLLPCKYKGLSQLLNPVKLLEATFYSIALGLRRVCEVGSNCKAPVWELNQTITMVIDLDRTGRNDGFRISRLFDTYRVDTCPITSSSRILIQNQHQHVETKPPIARPLIIDGLEYLSIDMKSSVAALADPNFNVADLQVKYLKDEIENDLKLTIHSYLAGTGQQKGWIKSFLTNKDTSTQTILYTHVIPAFLRVYLHTLSIECQVNNKIINLKPTTTEFLPGVLRKRPYTLSLVVHLPAQSTCTLSVNFEKSLLRWTEYPPDAHRGFPIPGPSLMFNDKSRKRTLRTLHAEAMLVTLPTPDFSMPYNVICLVCTVVALAFGPIHNLTTKSMVLMGPEEIEKRGMKFKIKEYMNKVKSYCTGLLENGQERIPAIKQTGLE